MKTSRTRQGAAALALFLASTLAAAEDKQAAPIPRVVIIGKRMTAEEKERFDREAHEREAKMLSKRAQPKHGKSSYAESGK